MSEDKQQDKMALRASQAGMRLIAQMHIYNQADDDRLLTFIRDSYTAALLDEQPADERLTLLKQWYDKIGKVRVKQVLATNEHHVIVVLETERDNHFYYTEMQVQDDYPHQITAFTITPLQVAQG